MGSANGIDTAGLRYRVGVIAPARTLHEVARTLSVQRRFEVVLCAPTVEECRIRLEARRPDVLVVFAAAERLEHVIREARTILPSVSITVCATSRDDTLELVTALRSGADGFVGTSEPIGTLLDVIGSVARGEVRYATPFAASVIKRLTNAAGSSASQKVGPALTAREREVAALMSSHSNRAIAEALAIELSTVKNHVHNILAKLLVRHRADAVAALGASRSHSANGTRPRSRSI